MGKSEIQDRTDRFANVARRCFYKTLLKNCLRDVKDPLDIDRRERIIMIGLSYGR
jgi:hypothetical protein